jgi:predicted ATPase/class 3 adenylate cyclase
MPPRMTDLPTGTVTFLFTDIEGSTRLLQELGNRYGAIQDRHQDILRRAIGAEDGVEIRTEGDSFFVVFRTPAQAIRAAVSAQRELAEADWPHGQPLLVRMGMHSGEGELGGGDYIGIDVNLAARIAAAGHGGQILLSDATKTLVEHSLPQGVTVRELGSHSLKDIEHPERIHDLVISGLSMDFPPIRTLHGGPAAFPTPRTSFVGRARELEEVTGLLRRSRLVTLTGPGGTGKTRLALGVAAEELARFRDGAFVVDLSAVTDPSVVPSKIATTLGIREDPTRDRLKTLSDHLRVRETLLVLDNFEQVIEATEVVGRLLDAAQGLRVLATSRVPLRLSGEHEYRVEPLPLPDPRSRGALEALGKCESVMLFVDRAAAVRRDFRLTEHNSAAIAGIVDRVDGLPLAIELAASRVRALSPGDLLARLEHRLPVLATGPRDLPARQRTLRDAIAWSHDLLNDDEQRLFARLAVFSAGFTLKSAEAVCGSGLDLDVMEGIEALVDHSLLQHEERKGRLRYRMLETIREFGAEHLQASGEAEEVRRRHAWHMLQMAEAAEPELLRKDRTRLDRLEEEHDNIRAALGWSIEGGDVETGLRLAGALWRFWQLRSHLAEGLAWTERLLSLPAAAGRTMARARALSSLGSLAYWMQDAERVRPSYEESLAISREVGDIQGQAEGTYNLAFVHLLDGDGRTAEELFEEAAERYREIGDDIGQAHANDGVALVATREGELERAELLLEQNLRMFMADEDMWGIALTSGQLALIGLERGELDRARTAALQSLSAGEALGAHVFNAVSVQALAVVAIRSGQVDRGLRLAGFSDRLRDLSGGEAPGSIVGIEDPQELVKDDLSPERIGALVVEGRSMGTSEGLAYAREPDSGH